MHFRVSAALFLVTLLQASLSLAFCRTTTCSRNADGLGEPCDLDEYDCAKNGALTAWRSGCVSFSVQEDASELRSISYAQTLRAARDAFEAWLTVDCGDGPPSLEVSETEAVSCHRREYNKSQPNANIVLFRDDAWPDDYDENAIALTTVTHEVNTGEIYDADIEINSFMMDVSVDGSGEFLLAAILKHEAGHFLGLDHARDSDAMMYRWYNASFMRELTADDVDGICAIYPPDRTPPSESCRPRHGFSGECARNESAGCTCTTPNLETRGEHAPAVVLLPGVLVWAARRRRRSAPRYSSYS